MTKYLTPEWADELTGALNESEAFRKEATRRNATIAWKVTGAPGGDTEFHLTYGDGTGRMALGPPPEEPSLRLTATYDILVQVATGELNGREAFIEGKIECDNALTTVIRYIPVFHEINEAQARLGIEY